MCLWLLTACLGLIPNSPQNVIVIPGVVTPIVQPITTTAAAVTTTTPAPPPGGSVPPGGTPPPGGMTPGNTNGGQTPPPLTNPPLVTMATNPPPASTIAMTNPPVTTSAATNPPSMATPPATNLPPVATTVSQQPTNTPAVQYLPVLICNNPNVVCAAYPNQIATGNPLIDPRLGMTPPASGAIQYQPPPISAYNAQLLQSDSAVKFPVQKRSVDNLYNESGMLNVLHKIKKRQTTSPCFCVATGTCTAPTTAPTPMIDFRIVTPTCPAGQVYCCGAQATPTVDCGVKQYVGAATAPRMNGQAPYGGYPWMGLVLTKSNDYVAGAVLVDRLHVITVIHRIQSYIVSGTAPNLKIRLGDWDSSVTTEPIPYQEYFVQRVSTHPSYNAVTLQYDVAVLRLTMAVPFSPTAGSLATINRACLPPSATTVYTNQRCWAAGWGKNAFGASGQYQQILKEVDVPIVDQTTCQTQLRNARLGATYVLDGTSFVCAGGEANKDSCTGDGGSGLFCQVNNQWVVVGLVSWGLGCATASVPGVYVNVAALLPWIQAQIAAP